MISHHRDPQKNPSLAGTALTCQF